MRRFSISARCPKGRSFADQLLDFVFQVTVDPSRVMVQESTMACSGAYVFPRKMCSLSHCVQVGKSQFRCPSDEVSDSMAVEYTLNVPPHVCFQSRWQAFFLPFSTLWQRFASCLMMVEKRDKQDSMLEDLLGCS